MQKASRDMEKLGIEILSCNIQNVQDENGLIQDLGAENTSLIKKNAAIAKAQADRDVAIAQANADKAANDATGAVPTPRLPRSRTPWQSRGVGADGSRPTPKKAELPKPPTRDARDQAQRRSIERGHGGRATSPRPPARPS